MYIIPANTELAKKLNLKLSNYTPWWGLGGEEV
jgi:hypothetical protein